MQNINVTAEQVLQACTTESASKIFAALETCPFPPKTSTLAKIAIENDRVDVLARLLATGTTPGQIPIRDIIRKRDTTMLEVLLENGWDINANLGSYQGCALTSAILSRAPVSFIIWLLDHGADVNGYPALPNCQGYALRLAMQMSEESTPTEVARLLLERGADVDRALALHMAVEGKRIDWVKWLVEEGKADVNALGIDLDWASQKEIEEGIERPLHYAARRGDAAIVQYLLVNGADGQWEDTFGRTPKEVAEQLGFVNIARLL